MAGSWSELVNAQISPSQSDQMHLVIRCVPAAFENNIVYQHQDSAITYIHKSFHIHPEGARKKRRYNTITDKDRSLNTTT